MKKETITEMIRRIMKEETTWQSSEAFRIFKKNGNRYGSLWAMTDDQDDRVSNIHQALLDAGFRIVKDSSLRSYDSYLVKGEEKVYYSARTGSPGFQAIRMVNPLPPEKSTSSTPKLKPEFTDSKLGKLKQILLQDLKDSKLTQWTANEWKKSADDRGTFSMVDAANKQVGIGLNELWPTRFHQLMLILIKMNKVKLTKQSGKNIYSLI